MYHPLHCLFLCVSAHSTPLPFFPSHFPHTKTSDHLILLLPTATSVLHAGVVPSALPQHTVDSGYGVCSRRRSRSLPPRSVQSLWQVSWSHLCKLLILGVKFSGPPHAHDSRQQTGGHIHPTFLNACFFSQVQGGQHRRYRGGRTQPVVSNLVRLGSLAQQWDW